MSTVWRTYYSIKFSTGIVLLGIARKRERKIQDMELLHKSR